MLKSIIKDEDLAMKIRKRPARRRHAIRIAQDRCHTNERLCQQSRFVASLARIGQQRLAI